MQKENESMGFLDQRSGPTTTAQSAAVSCSFGPRLVLLGIMERGDKGSLRPRLWWGYIVDKQGHGQIHARAMDAVRCSAVRRRVSRHVAIPGAAEMGIGSQMKVQT